MNYRGLTGEGVLTDAFGQKRERSTFTCVHCQTIVEVEPFCDPHDVGWCWHCNAPICDKPKCHDVCLHAEKRVEIAEKTGEWR